ncbi:MAG TPA: glycogen debranching N-terminal domain-containing protein [Ktedonobacteraceae bacterium]|nr:glycogen debranching N-terminal domain-containing protein [Ktedonobacteraceae bacterium]
MKDLVSEMILLPMEEIQQEETIKVDASEDKAHPGTTQITLKCGDAFVVTNVHGDLVAAKQEMGLFWHGMRFLRTCNLLLEQRPLMALSHHIANMGDACQIDLTNIPFTAAHDLAIEQGVIHVNRHIELHGDYLAQTFTITSFHSVPVPLTLSLKLDADFCDLFEVRGLRRERHGELQPIRANNTTMVFSYRGLDNVERATQVEFEPAANHVSLGRIDWTLDLIRGQAVQICIKARMRDGEAKHFSTDAAVSSRQDLPQPTLQTNDPFFNRLLTRGMHDLVMLSTMTPHGYYPYAGIPWFCCPFGRDGLITALEFLPWFPQVVRGTLAFLAAHQGTKVEPFTDEEPGKILHEFRMGELANCREIPYIPYYGTIDATLLFLITLEGYIRWTNDLAFLKQLWPHAQAAARWMSEYGDRDHDGFIEYHKTSPTGLDNQGWKDSWDAISHGDGRLATSPLALCEVQGYAFAAYRAMGYLASRMGKADEAGRWGQIAKTLRENFLRHFWWEQEHALYLALDKDKAPCDVVTSNAGQCLWTGIVPEEQAKLIISRLMREDMYSGWGLRTLSAHAKRYNPMSYHNGSVWPHDTALVGAGFSRYGGKSEAAQLLKGMFEASLYFEGARLPELHCGFAQRHGYGPTRYPVACSPQGWAAGAPFMLINGLLGFQPSAEEQRLTLHASTLPDWLYTLEIDGLYVGSRRVHLRFERTGEHTEVIASHDNEVDIHIV